MPEREHFFEHARIARTLTFTHPDDVLHDRTLSLGEKRAILANWASDAHAVQDRPGRRQLESGAIVPIDTVLAALRALDADIPAGGPSMLRWRRRRPSPIQLLPAERPRDDDDDDPPPSPAAATSPAGAPARDDAWALAA